jgi:hypothetical protein
LQQRAKRQAAPRAGDLKSADMKAFILDEAENLWGGFLYDKDCCDSKVVQRYLHPGTPTEMRTDAETVAEARDSCKTIVTSNGDDFIRYIREAQKRDVNPRCDDLWGLVIIPNRDLQREYAFNKVPLHRGLNFRKVILPWKAVGYANLCVKFTTDGKVHISRFERCKFCERNSPITGEWYTKLPLVRAHRQAGNQRGR